VYEKCAKIAGIPAEKKNDDGTTVVSSPFLTMAFGRWVAAMMQLMEKNKKQLQGLNLQLPNANLKDDDKMADKMSFYDQADKDSIKLAEEMRNDPYYRHQDSMQNVYLKELEQLLKVQRKV
jgi:hypothetical protein